jgi:hypothetical protein
MVRPYFEVLITHVLDLERCCDEFSAISSSISKCYQRRGRHYSRLTQAASRKGIENLREGNVKRDSAFTEVI